VDSGIMSEAILDVIVRILYRNRKRIRLRTHRA
jgi:hypothetical protein